MGKRLSLITAAAALVLAASCDDDPTSPGEDGLETLRQVTDAYHDVEVATQDGFVNLGVCEDPEGPGALGIPFLYEDRLDTTIDIENPEVLFYEPQQNGDLELVGVEMVVPIDAWEAQHGDEIPSVLGQEFHRNDQAGLLGIHVWIWRDNPNGMFEFAHPNVSCQYAE